MFLAIRMSACSQERTFDYVMRADAMLEKGDLDGYGVWKRVLKAVEELLRIERIEGERVN